MTEAAQTTEAGSQTELDAMLTQDLHKGETGQGSPDTDNTNSQKSSQSGKQTETTAPDGGQAGGATGKTKARTEQSSDQGQAVSTEAESPEKRADELKSLLGQETPEQRLERIERDYKASSTEARELKESLVSFSELLKKQGLKLKTDVDGKAQLVPTGKKADAKAEPFSLEKADTKALTDLLESDATAEEVTQFFSERVREPEPQVAPTAESVVEAISAERRQEAITAVSTMFKDTHSDITKNTELIDWLLTQAPAEVKKAYHAAPEFMLRLMDAEIIVNDLQRERLAQKRANENKEKQEAASQAEDLSGESGGGSPQAGTSDVATKMAERIAKGA